MKMRFDLPDVFRSELSEFGSCPIPMSSVGSKLASTAVRYTNSILVHTLTLRPDVETDLANFSQSLLNWAPPGPLHGLELHQVILYKQVNM